jgi:hypothetical protein
VAARTAAKSAFPAALAVATTKVARIATIAKTNIAFRFMLTSLVLAIGRKLFSFDQVANDQSMGQTAGLTYQFVKFPKAACFNMMIRINYIIIQPVTWRKIFISPKTVPRNIKAALHHSVKNPDQPRFSGELLILKICRSFDFSLFFSIMINSVGH